MSDQLKEDLSVVLFCPVGGDWEGKPGERLVSQQLAGLLGHIEQVHCTAVPEPVREQIRACKRELEELPV